MGLGDFEFMLIVLFIASVVFYINGKRENLHEQAMMASRAAVVSLLGALACAYPLGWWHFRDSLLVAGLGGFILAVVHRGDFGISRIIIYLSAISLALWVMFYQMSWTHYGVGFGLVVFDAFIVDWIIRHWNWGDLISDRRQVGLPKKVGDNASRPQAMTALNPVG